MLKNFQINIGMIIWGGPWWGVPCNAPQSSFITFGCNIKIKISYTTIQIVKNYP
jgi:hypothetical protein